MLEHNGQIGIVVPVYQKHFFFQTGYNPQAVQILRQSKERRK
jgi:hypothetical protein